MSREYNRQEIRGFHDRNTGRLFTDIVFNYCRFISCTISTTTKPSKRSIIRKVRLNGCEVTGCTIYPAIIEDVLVSGLKTHTLLQTWGAVFKHVKLEGNIGRIMLSPLISIGRDRPKAQAAFDKANTEYYQKVDWALDISEGRFYEIDIRGIPAHLIKRDSESQVVVTREKALLGEWRNLDLSKTYWDTGIQFMLNRGDNDVVLVAPKRDPKYSDLLDGLKKLRDAGVAEPD